MNKNEKCTMPVDIADSDEIHKTDKWPQNAEPRKPKSTTSEANNYYEEMKSIHDDTSKKQADQNSMKIKTGNTCPFGSNSLPHNTRSRKNGFKRSISETNQINDNDNNERTGLLSTEDSIENTKLCVNLNDTKMLKQSTEPQPKMIYEQKKNVRDYSGQSQRRNCRLSTTVQVEEEQKQIKSVNPVKNIDIKEKGECRCKNLFNTKCFFRQLISLVLAVLIIIITGIVLRYFFDIHIIYQRPEYKQTTDMSIPQTHIIPVSKFVSLSINWTRLDSMNQNASLRLPWLGNGSFISFEEASGSLIIEKNGTYSFTLSINFDTSDISKNVSDNERFKSLVCLRNDRDNDELCNRHSLAPYTAVQVNIQSTVYLVRGDRVWVNVNGARQIYQLNAVNRLNVQYNAFPNG